MNRPLNFVERLAGGTEPRRSPGIGESPPQSGVILRLVGPSRESSPKGNRLPTLSQLKASCGVYVAALIATTKERFATVNVDAIHALGSVPEAVPVSYEEESTEQRTARRE